MRQTGINMEKVKHMNRASILKYINQFGPVSRKDIACDLGLTPAAVTQICEKFMELGILIECGSKSREGCVGRKKVLIDLNYEYRYVYGIHIDPVNTVIALTNLKGSIKKINTISTDKQIEPELFLKKIADICLNMQEEICAIDQIAGAGVGVTGIVDTEQGISVHAYGLWDEQVHIAKLLSILLNVPVKVENDEMAFAKAELMFGAGKDKSNLLLVKWEDEIASALVSETDANANVKSQISGIGHIIVNSEGKKCSCGRRGCLNTFASFTEIKNTIEELFSYQDTPKLFELVHGDFRNFDHEIFSKTLVDPDITIRNIIDELAEKIALALINTITIMNPQMVVICGKMFDDIKLRDMVIQKCLLLDESYKDSMIVSSRLTAYENYLGPVSLIAEEVLNVI